MLSINIQGVDQAGSYLDTKNKKIINAIRQQMVKSVLFLETEVKMSISGQRAEPVSVDTGRFMRSVKGVVDKDNTGTVATNVDYSVFLEYGTRKIKPRMHFRNTVQRNTVKVQDGFTKSIKDAVK